MTPEIEGGRFGCPHCPDRFESVGDKKRHIRTDHTPTSQKETLR